MNPVNSYIEELQQTMNRLPQERIEQVIQLLVEARMSRRQVFIMGNGGSASTASHFVCDLAKNTRKHELPNYRVIGLTDNMAIFSALANDEGYESVFAQQLVGIVQPGDIVIGISASGNSPNVLNAMEVAKMMSATTIGFTGFNGGRLSSLVDYEIHVASNCIEHVEDIHLMLEHLIVKAIKDMDLAEFGYISAEAGGLIKAITVVNTDTVGD
jgi:D-sedoheptulose 7-phosphate isomerase